VSILAVLEFPLSPSLFADSVADCVGSVDSGVVLRADR
jgi:hypothetical protein